MIFFGFNQMITFALTQASKNYASSYNDDENITI